MSEVKFQHAQTGFVGGKKYRSIQPPRFVYPILSCKMLFYIYIYIYILVQFNWEIQFQQRYIFGGEPRKYVQEGCTLNLSTCRKWQDFAKLFASTTADTNNPSGQPNNTGWWLSHPSEKYESQLGLFFPIYGKINQLRWYPQQPQRFIFTNLSEACCEAKGCKHLSWVSVNKMAANPVELDLVLHESLSTKASQTFSRTFSGTRSGSTGRRSGRLWCRARSGSTGL